MTPEEIVQITGIAENLGILSIMALLVNQLWKSWGNERAERDKERDELLAKIDALQNERVLDAKKWAETAEVMLGRALTMNGK